MPVLLEGIHICEICKKRFDWVYFEIVKSKLTSGTFTVEKIPNKPRAYRVEITNSNEHEIFVNCPYCGYDNRFIYEKSL